MNSDNLIKILFLASDPSDTSRLRLQQEYRDIEERLQLAKHRERFLLKPQLAVRVEDITQAILNVEPQIVHFSGHGTSTGALCFENQLAQAQPIEPDALAVIFELFAEQVNCVVLNACYSQPQAEAIAKHIQFVIGMNQAIGDRAAIAFSVGFYKALGANRSIDMAYKFGRAEIQLQSIPEHSIPVLHVKKDLKEKPCEAKWMLVLSATIDEIDRARAEAIVAHLRQISGDLSLTLKKIEVGSVKLFLEGSQDGLKHIEALFKAGLLNEIVGIPVQDVRNADSESTSSSEILTRSIIRILLIDDNPDERFLMFQQLQQTFPNIEVEEITEAEALFQALSVGSFDLVLIDDQLRWSNGLNVLRAVKEISPDHPVVMFISSGNEQIIAEALKVGLDDYVMKSSTDNFRLTVAVRNILERAKAKRKAARLDTRLQSLLHRVNIGVFRLTVDGRLLEGNAAFLSLLGLNSLSEVQSTNIQQLYLQAQHPPELTQWEQEVLLRRADGSSVCVLLKQTLSSIDGETVIDGLMEDISERKQAEAERDRLLQLEQTTRAEAERANRFKDEFLATISHELRTPLNTVLGWAKLLQSRKFDSAKTAQALTYIERNAESLSQLINDLLDLSRIQQGKLSLNASSVNLVSIISTALDSVRLVAQAKSIQFQTVFEPNVGQVAGDATRLQQVVWNLLSNAVKFTPSGGRVEVRLAQVNSLAQIQVIDTGEGISSNFLPYVFDSFRQPKSSATRRFGGLGLGLALVRHLVELHGGTVTAESPGVGQGATFTVQLPLYQNESSREQSLPTSSTIRVLVVDDHELTRLTLKLAFSAQENIQVVGLASNGREAIEMVERYRPDMVILDLHMPEMGGWSAASHIKSIAPNTQIIAYSSVEDPTFQQMREIGSLDAFCKKDVPTTELIALVRQLGQRANSQFSNRES
ncbi:response regulator [Tolypothrix campylonemoides VB511288]|nr:response regulator [Tolypothrix campylonemoides VB511288]